MISVETYLPKQLFPLIKAFWSLHVSSETGVPYEEEIIPDAHHEIIFHLNSAPAERKTGNESWRREPAAFFAGQDLKSFRVRLQPGTLIYGIRFQPHTQALFFDFPASVTTDYQLPLDDFGHSAGALRRCLSDRPEATFANFEEFFSKRIALLRATPEPFRYVDFSVREILKKKGNVRIDSLVSKTGISLKHLDNSFKKFVGITPKVFCSIVKFNHFIHYRRSNPSKSLTECAHETHFYDQPHLIRASHIIVGKSPKDCLQVPDFINTFLIGA